MELSDLKVFLAVVEQGGVNRAAEQLHRVPSNITARIKKLESDLGQDLFVRERNRLTLSSAGHQLTHYAKSMLAMAHEAREKINNHTEAGQLKVGAMEAVAASRLSPVLKTFHQQHPKTQLQIATGPTGMLVDQIEAGELDIALVADIRPTARLHSVPVFSEKLTLVSATSHRPIKRPSDIQPAASLLAFNPLCAYRARFLQWLGTQTVQHKVIEIQSYHGLLNCVAAGMGVGVVPENVLALYPFVDDLAQHALPKKIADSRTWAISQKGKQTSQIEGFYNVLNGFGDV